MKANFQTSLAAVLKHEGGYVNHPKDPGGETNKGVTKAVYDAYRDRNGLPRRSVKYLADDELHDIYKDGYWDVVRGDELPSGVDYAVFDFAVNSGPSRAIKYLQTSVGAKPDGVMGPMTVAAVGLASPRDTINAVCDNRMAFLRNLPTFDTFGKGWTSRVSGVRAMAIGMTVNYFPMPDVDPPKDPPYKEPEGKVGEDAAPPPSPGASIASVVMWALGALIAAVAAWIGFGK